MKTPQSVLIMLIILFAFLSLVFHIFKVEKAPTNLPTVLKTLPKTLVEPPAQSDYCKTNICKG